MKSPKELVVGDPEDVDLAVLAAAAWLLGDRRGAADLKSRAAWPQGGFTLDGLIAAFEFLNLSARRVTYDRGTILDVTAPAVLQRRDSSYVVLKKAGRRRITLFDPSAGWRTVPIRTALASLTGVALEIAPSPAFKRRARPSPLNVWSLVHWSPTLTGALLQTLALSLVLQAYVLISPFYMRIAVDHGVMKGDADILLTIGLGFLLLALFNVGATWLRGLAVQGVSARLSWDMSRQVFQHALRLPMEWYERRRLADCFSRFQALDAIRNIIANGMVTAAIDGVLSLSILVVVMMLAPPLAWVSIIFIAIYSLARVALMPLSLSNEANTLAASIAEQSKRLEALRTVQTIKTTAVEREREYDWSNKMAELVRQRQACGLHSVTLATVQTWASSLSAIAIVFVGSRLILAGEMTLGLLYTIIIYQTQLMQRVVTFLETAISWRMLHVWSSRLADLVLAPIEGGGAAALRTHEAAGQVRAEHVAFRYSPVDPPVLRSVQFAVEPGAFVALVGPSGSGKSTLLKLVCGLYAPTGGTLLVDGTPTSAWHMTALRRSMGVVLQDDALFSGTLLENLSSMDPVPDAARVLAALEEVDLAAKVSRLPHGLNTVIGDTTACFSTGEIRRLHIARSLYRSPSILLFDEPTANLDEASEAIVIDLMRRHTATRIVASHNSRLISAADRVIMLKDGMISRDSLQNLGSGVL